MSKKTIRTKNRVDFPDLLNRAGYGRERVVISRRGKPFAAIISIEDVMMLERLEDSIDIELARKTIGESEGTTFWEDALRIL